MRLFLFRYFLVPVRLFFICAVFFSCEYVSCTDNSYDDSNQSTLRIVSWNIQTLFDGKEQGTEFDEYTEAAGWNEASYTRRLKKLQDALVYISGKGLDFLALQEVENSQILSDLVSGPLKEQGFCWTAFSAQPGAAFGLGLISRHPIDACYSHAVLHDGVLTPRPVLEVHATVCSQALVILVCHWKSKLGGIEESEAARRSAARIVRQRLDILGKTRPDLPVLVAGDLNTRHDEFLKSGATYVTALVPDIASAAELVKNSPCAEFKNYIVISDKKSTESCYFKNEYTLYSPWPGSEWNGSYVYKNNWESIDHFLYNSAFFDDIGWDYESFSVLDGELFLDDSRYPCEFNPRTGAGYSDHFPVSTVLVKQ